MTIHWSGKGRIMLDEAAQAAIEEHVDTLADEVGEAYDRYLNDNVQCVPMNGKGIAALIKKVARE